VSLDTIASSPVGIRMLDVLVSEGFATGRLLSDLSEAALYEIAARAAVEVSSEKWSSFPGRCWPWEELASADKVERLARAVPECGAARWWSGGIFDRPQVWLGSEHSVPAGGQLHAACAQKPPTQIWTSSAFAGNPSAWWPVVNGGAAGPPPDALCSIWRLTLDPDARVFEIRTLADYRWLCETFPGPVVDGRIGPDWEAAAERFDGVHLTVDGLIHTQGVEIETNRGPAMLDDWDAESTAWLHFAFRSVERIGTIESDHAYVQVRPRRAFRRTRRRS
jgi:hypothetical protein